MAELLHLVKVSDKLINSDNAILEEFTRWLDEDRVLTYDLYRNLCDVAHECLPTTYSTCSIDWLFAIFEKHFYFPK